jgi:hypothetical protein
MNRYNPNQAMRSLCHVNPSEMVGFSGQDRQSAGKFGRGHAAKTAQCTSRQKEAKSGLFTAP